MLVLLVHLPNGDVPDPTLGQPLGTRAEVMARIVELLPGTTFDGTRGKFKRTSYELTFSIDGYQPRAVTVDIDRDEGLIALKRVVEKTGWHVIDPTGPYFVDLGSEPAPAARAAVDTVTARSSSDSAPARRPQTSAETRPTGGLRGLLVAAATLVLVAGALLSWLYAGGFSRVFASLEDPAVAEQRRTALTHILDQVRGCVDKYEASNPERGFPASLQQLGPNGERCLAAGVAGGQEAGYRFAYLPGVPNAAGTIQIYSVCARPAKFPSDGKDTLVASPRTGTKVRTRDQQDATDSYSCVEAYDEPVALIEHCALAYAAEHPQAGYPPSLADVHDCVMTSGSSIIRTHSIQKDGHRYTYIAGEADERGVIARFEIYGVARATYAGANQIWADETGAVRIGHAQALATPFDPLEQDDRKAASESVERSKIEPQELRRRCDTGDQQWCLELAAYERKAATEQVLRGETADVPTIVRLYSTACESGTASACAALGDFYIDGKVVSSNLVKASPLLDRACTLGDGEACHRFATLLRESSTQDGADYVGRRQRAAQLDQRGCDAGNARSCFSLAELSMQGGAVARARAATLFEESCKMGIAEACRRLAGLRDNDQRLLLKACASGDFAECEEINPPVEQQ